MSLERHAGDCTIYSSLHNERPEDGVCTCGYGFQERRRGNESEMYSGELKEKLNVGRVPISREEVSKMIENIVLDVGED